MKVLIVNNRLDADGGGTSRKAVTLAGALRSAGCDVRLAAFAFGPAVGPESGDRTHYVPYAIRRWPLPAVWPAEVSTHVAWADVVLLVNHWTTINAVYGLAAWRHRKGLVVMPCGALPIFGRSAWIKRLYNAVIGHRLVRTADAAIAVTALEARDFASYGVPPARVEVIPNAVAPDEADAADAARFRQRWQQDRPFLLYAGRLAAIKGPDLLLHAWRRVAPGTSLDLVLAGSPGDMTQEVEQWLADHGREARVRWIGPLDHGALLDAFSAAHALVVPSRSEAMSLVLLEAALTGRPVIATTACGVPDVALHGGLEVAPSEAALAEGLAAAVGWSSEEASARGATLQAYVRATHTWAAVTPRYLDVLARAVRRQ